MVSTEDGDVFGIPTEELEVVLALHAEVEGQALSEAMVEAARDEASPLHHRFEWDDTIAGEKYRLIQAEEIIRVVVYRPRDAEPDSTPVRYFAATKDVSDDPAPRGSYSVTPRDVVGNKRAEELLLRQIQRELAALRGKYGAHESLFRRAVEDFFRE